jgi:hypothetical protein
VEFEEERDVGYAPNDLIALAKQHTTKYGADNAVRGALAKAM